MTTRRDFIKKTGTLTAGAWLLPSFAHKRQQIGIQLWTVRDEINKNVHSVISQIAQFGYKEVEIFIPSADNKLWGLSAKQFKTLLDENKLSCPSGHYQFGDYFKNGSLEEVNKSIEMAHILGSEYLTIPSIGYKYENTLEACKATANKLNTLGGICKKSGLKLAYHNHNSEFKQFGNTYCYEIWLKETDPELVHFEMDLYWMISAGKDPIRLFKQFPHRFPLWHVKDMDKIKSELNANIGDGSIDFKAIFAQAKLSGMKHFFVEQENNYQPNVMDAVKADAHYIKQHLL